MLLLLLQKLLLLLHCLGLLRCQLQLLELLLHCHRLLCCQLQLLELLLLVRQKLQMLLMSRVDRQRYGNGRQRRIGYRSC